MKRNRVKAVGLGVALWAGYLHGEDAPRPAPPAVLPATVRASDWTPAPAASDAVWLPARPSSNLPATPPTPTVVPPTSPAPALVTPAAFPVVVPEIKPQEGKPEFVKPISNPGLVEVPAGPRGAASSLIVGPILEIPLPTIPVEVAAKPATFPIPATLGSPPELPAIPTTIPVAIPTAQPEDPLPKPRTVPPAIPPAKDLLEPSRLPAERELQTAPPELMVPPGSPVPGKHGTFGSHSVRISKDYPSVREMMDHDSGWWGGRESKAETSEAASSAMDRLEFRAEYLLWFANNQHVPILATTSDTGGFGFLGDPGTRTLLGPGSFGNSLRNGMRLRGGYWFDDCGKCGVDASFFFLGKQTSSQSFDSGTNPTITRPIFAPNFPGEFGEIVALPGASTGTLTIESTSTLWGFDVNLRHALRKDCDFHSEVFAGYRFLALNESLTINEFITALPGNTNDPAGTRVAVSDRFETRNRFNGGQVGYAAEKTWNRWSVDGRASLALGNTTQTVEITGYQSRLRPGMTSPDVFSGGLLATGPNLGTFSQNRFSVAPEFSLNVGFWVTPVLKAYVGYNFLYWSNVIRPGDQIDRVVDVTFVPNPPPGVPFSGQNRPQPTFQQADLFVNGIQFGLMGRW